MPPPDATNSTASSTTRVLLVDDHALVRQGMAAIINEQPDLTVCGEADGVLSAIAAVAETTPNVVLVDLSIKDGDGLELLRDIRNRFPDVSSLVISMYDETVYAERALRAGAKAYIMKAEAAKTLIGAIRLVLQGGTYLSPRMTAQLADRQHRVPTAAVRGGESLSDRELQVLRCVGRGLSTREIAEELFISIKTVEAHREHIKEKLGLLSAGELLRYAIEHNRIHG